MTTATLTLPAEHLALVFSRLNERQRRWTAGAMAEMLGHGGIKQIAEIAGLDPKTVRQGRNELARNLEDFPDDDRVRRPGGGRPPIEKKFPTSGNNSN